MSESNEHGLRDALRALPLQAPAGDGWARLSRELAPAKPPRRSRAWFAVAACALLAVGAVVLQKQLATQPGATVPAVASSTTPSPTTETPMNATKDTNPQLLALQSRSRELEKWLHETNEVGAPLPSGDLAAADEIESLIGVVDVELAAPQQHDEEKLWRRRVNLLEDLTALRYSNYRLAEGGATAAPAHWIN